MQLQNDFYDDDLSDEEEDLDDGGHSPINLPVGQGLSQVYNYDEYYD